ncbi:MAG: site-specific integrase [Planctomycetota bacterium]
MARLAPQSVTNAVTSVGSILSWCVEKRILKENVAHGVRASKSDQGHECRLPYRPEDLKRIFEDLPVFARGHRPHGGAGHAAYWIPVLALYTGARLEEIGQLMLQDIRTEGGVVFLEIGDAAEGQSVKNAASRRRVPLHQRVIQLGFMDYLAETRRRGHQDLFPHVQSTKAKRTAAYSKWVNRYFRQACGITDRRKVFHSFRHTFSDACREAEIPREVRNALMGHRTSGVDQEYGDGFSLRVLDRAVQKIQYPGFQIPPWQAAHA